MGSKRLQVIVPKELAERAQELAKADGRTLSNLIQQALRREVRAREKEKADG